MKVLPVLTSTRVKNLLVIGSPNHHHHPRAKANKLRRANREVYETFITAGGAR